MLRALAMHVVTLSSMSFLDMMVCFWQVRRLWVSKRIAEATSGVLSGLSTAFCDVNIKISC